MERITVSRRALLGGAAATGAVSLAGCLQKVPFVGSSTRYRKWLPSPEESGMPYSDFTMIHPGAIAKHEQVPEAFAVDTQPFVPVDRPADAVGFGVAFEELSTVLGYGNFQSGQFPVHVVWGPHDEETLTAYLQEHGYESHSEYEGFDVWGRHLWDGEGKPSAGVRQKGRAVAFDGEVLVTSIVTSSANTQLDHLKMAIQTGQGAVDRLHDDSTAASELLNELRRGDLRVNRTFPVVEPALAEETPGRFAGQIGKGVQFDVRGERTKLRSAYVFEESDDADAEAVQEYLKGLRGMTPTVGTATPDPPYGEFEATVESDGRSVVVEGRLPTTDLTMTRWP